MCFNQQRQAVSECEGSKIFLAVPGKRNNVEHYRLYRK